MQIRPAKLEDAEQIAAIYAPIVEHTIISFEERAPSAAEMRDRIASYTKTHPWLVAVDGNDAILGYAYAAAHRERAGYRWSADASVYVREDARGRGVAKKLYSDLFALLGELEFHRVFAGIALPNDASVALHRSFGFTLVGTYREVGRKFGSWIDTTWWQRDLTPAELRS